MADARETDNTGSLEAGGESIGSGWAAILVPLLMVGVITVWAFTSWSKDCHAEPTSEIAGWPYFALGLTFFVPALIAWRRGKSLGVSVVQGALSLILAVFLYFAMYWVYLSVYAIDLGGCLG
jgi:Zn-dependent protease with chaperone function